MDKENICTVRNFEGAYFHINMNGERIYPAKYRYTGDFKDSIACVMLENGRFKHIDSSGEFVYPFEFLDIGVYHKGLATARDERGWMHIDLDGKAQYDNRFIELEPLYNDSAFARLPSGARIIVKRSGGVFSMHGI